MGGRLNAGADLCQPGLPPAHAGRAIAGCKRGELATLIANLNRREFVERVGSARQEGYAFCRTKVMTRAEQRRAIPPPANILHIERAAAIGLPVADPARIGKADG